MNPIIDGSPPLHQEWRDISSYVSVEWSVAMETAAGLRQLVPLGVFKTAANQVRPAMKHRMVQGKHQGSSQKIFKMVDVQIRSHDT